MSSGAKQLSNSFSTGGGGSHFEAHIQASFVVLMLTGGCTPSLPCWPIVELKLQGKIEGYDTDDLIVFVENSDTGEKRKLLGQVKHSVKFVKSSKALSEVIEAAWNDFQNSTVFTKRKDCVALITGPLSETDAHNVSWLLEQARRTKNSAEFFINIKTAKFSPPKASEKLEVFRHHLKNANSSAAVTDEELYAFMNDFHLLGYDLGREVGVTLSLLHSHISQFNSDNPQWVWSRIVDIVQTWNQSAGTIIKDKLPDDLKEVFKQKQVENIPVEFAVPENPATDWNNHASAPALALADLIGNWDENNEADLEVIRGLIDGL